MTKAILFLAALTACGDDTATIDPDAAPPIDSPVLPDARAINWDEYGGACAANQIVLKPCSGTSGGAGWCAISQPHVEVEPSLFAGTCQPSCQGVNYLCPSDSMCKPSPEQGFWICVRNY